MMFLSEDLPHKMKDMKVGVKAYIFSLLYIEHHAHITFQQVKICLSDLPHHLHIEHTHLNDPATSTPCDAI